MSSNLIIPFIFLQIATVVAIVMFLRMLLHKQLEAGMQRIKRLDQENMEKEVGLNNKLEKLNDEYDKKLKDAEQQSDSLLGAAKESAKEMRDTERMRAKEEAKKIIASAMQEKEKTLRETRREIHRKAIDLSVTVLQRVLSEGDLSGLRCKIAEDAMDALFESDDVEELIRKHKSAEVVTADDLPQKDKDKVSKIIEKLSGGKAEVKFATDKNILGGLVLKIGESVVDSGLLHRINKAVIALRDEVR